MDLQSRIEALERQNVRLTRITAALTLCLGGMLLMAAVPKNFGDLECRSLKVSDPRSNAVVEVKSIERDVGAERNMGVIVTVDGKKVASFGNRETRGGLTVKSDSHSMTISPDLVTAWEGEPNRDTFDRATFGTLNRQGFVSVLDENGLPSAIMLGGIEGVPGSIAALAPRLNAQDVTKTKPEGAILSAKALILSDKNGKPRNMIEVDPGTGNPRVRFLDAAGKEKKLIE